MNLVGKTVDLLKKNSLNLFFISFFLVRIPPIFVPLPFLNIITTHILYRLINLVLLLFILISKKNLKDIFNFKNRFLLLVLIYFFTQSLSGTGAINVFEFLIQFEKITSTFIFFLISYYFIYTQKERVTRNSIASQITNAIHQSQKSKLMAISLKTGIIKKIIFIFIITTSINILFQLFIFIDPKTTLSLMQRFVHQGVIDIINMNLGRDRLYFEFYDEIVIPLLFFMYFVKSKGKINNLFYILLIILIVVLSFASNIRSRFLVVAVSTVGFFIIFNYKNLIKTLVDNILIFLLMIATLFLANSFLVKAKGYSLVDRFLLEDKLEDEQTLYFRKNMFLYAYDIGCVHPFGAGLGNFYEYLPTKLKQQVFSLQIGRKEQLRPSLLYPHNIFAQTFAESGLIGLISLLLMVIYFLKKDIPIVLNRDNLLDKSVVVSFWSLSLYVMFNPSSTLTFFSTFWILRIVIEVLNIKKVYV